jgi:hypothetical protein
MKYTFSKKYKLVQNACAEFELTDRINYMLDNLSGQALDNSPEFILYHDFLLFVLAHPRDKNMLATAEKELKRLALHLKNPKNSNHELFADSGLPHTKMITRYSHDLIRWMMQSNWKMNLDSFEEDGAELNDILKATLPSLLREETTAGLSNEELLERLGIKPKDQLQFLVNEFSKLDRQPYLKDQLWQSLKPFVLFEFNQAEFSKSYNRFLNRKVFFQREIQKQVDHKTLFQTALPNPAKLSVSDRAELVAVIRRSMIQTLRETDTSTYMDAESLRLYELERGISIAIYGMTPERQLPLQSYIGYTLFKNGFPAAYGGSWILGKSAKFGLNVFEAFRGGESGLIMCQLLRTYIQAFNLNYIEIDAYQFGKDNMDGIRSGAYWFYYRYGFRSLNRSLNQLAAKEMALIKSKKGYRTKEKTLIELAESNIALNLGAAKPFRMDEVSTKVAAYISRNFKGDMSLAVQTCVTEFKRKADFYIILNNAEKQVLEEVSIFAATYEIKDKKRLRLLKHMVKLKPENPYAYNKIWIDFLG